MPGNQGKQRTSPEAARVSAAAGPEPPALCPGPTKQEEGARCSAANGKAALLPGINTRRKGRSCGKAPAAERTEHAHKDSVSEHLRLALITGWRLPQSTRDIGELSFYRPRSPPASGAVPGHPDLCAAAGPLALEGTARQAEGHRIRPSPKDSAIPHPWKALPCLSLRTSQASSGSQFLQEAFPAPFNARAVPLRLSRFILQHMYCVCVCTCIHVSAHTHTQSIHRGVHWAPRESRDRLLPARGRVRYPAVRLTGRPQALRPPADDSGPRAAPHGRSFGPDLGLPQWRRSLTAQAHAEAMTDPVFKKSVRQERAGETSPSSFSRACGAEDPRLCVRGCFPGSPSSGSPSFPSVPPPQKDRNLPRYRLLGNKEAPAFLEGVSELHRRASWKLKANEL
ncbi:uncharacterized protein LOC127538518 [Antechinus flavipes]|uniref:uncharacterized protein LOC127538518 n=1 Tax=Antechinus flavipes TaxID=38775 RepID=UPI00223622E4|nr:uncharacterized protein LOC127538518 [Antechinus flavipes]